MTYTKTDLHYTKAFFPYPKENCKFATPQENLSQRAKLNERTSNGTSQKLVQVQETRIPLHRVQKSKRERIFRTERRTHTHSCRTPLRLRCCSEKTLKSAFSPLLRCCWFSTPQHRRKSDSSSSSSPSPSHRSARQAANPVRTRSFFGSGGKQLDSYPRSRSLR